MGRVKFWDPDDSSRPNFPFAPTNVNANTDALVLATYSASLGGEWLIDPSAEGLTQLAYADGSEVAAGTVTDGAFVGANWRWSERSAHMESVVDATATGGRVLRQVYPAGYTGGGEPGTLYDSPPSGSPLMYWRLKNFKLSAGWQGHSSGINKMIFCGSGGSPNNVVVFTQRGAGPYAPRLVVAEGVSRSAYLDTNLAIGFVVNDGEAHNYEVWVDASRDLIGMAVDGVQTMHRIGNDGYVHDSNDVGTGGVDGQDYGFTNATPYWTNSEWAPTWGGLNDTVAVEQYEELDTIEVWTGAAGLLDAFTGTPDNKPAPMTVTIDTTFSNGLPVDGSVTTVDGMRYNSEQEDITAGSSVGGAKNGFVAQANYSIGYVGGGTPGTLWPGGGVHPADVSAYTRYRFRTSNPWDAHSTGTNKLSFIDFNPSGNFFIGFTANDSGPEDYRIFTEVQTGAGASGRMFADQNADAAKFNAGDWVWVEVYVDAVDDLIKVWINGVLTLDQDGSGAGAYAYALGATSAFEPSLEPIWGGGGDSKTTNDFIQFDAWLAAYGDGTEF